MKTKGFLIYLRVIRVQYADEDIGSNCGTLTIKSGAVVEWDESAGWSKMSKAEQEKWQAFAYVVKGWEPSPGEDD